MAELALAIIPLVFEGVRLGRGLKRKFSTFKSYMDTVEEAQTLFQVQIMAFLHECKLMLHAATDGSDDMNAAHLLEDVDPDAWSSPKLEDCLQSYLGNSEEPFKALLGLICKKIDKIDKDLSIFDERDEEGREGGTITHRVRNRVRVQFDEELYEKEIEKLRRLVSNLRGLRERVGSDKSRSIQNSKRSSNMPSEYRARKHDATIWLKSTTETWSCKSDNHQSHHAKLLLASGVQGRRGRDCLDIVIFRTTPSSDAFNSSHCTDISFASQQICVNPRAVPVETGLLTPESSIVAGDVHPQNLDGNDPKRRRVQCSSDGSEPKSTACDPHSGRPLSLAGVGDVCRHLADHPACHSFSASDSTSLGYVESQLQRFELFPGHGPGGQPRPYLNGRLVPLQDVFHKHLDESVRDPHRFWLASLVVKSALMHHNTAWWPEDWTLDFLSFYERPTDELADSLQTLHLTAELPGWLSPGKGADEQPGSDRRNQSDLDAMRQAMTEHGIRNLTLWCVGVALLQIGLWQPIRWDSHVEVRESLPRLERINRQYAELTDRLINCDFGKGARLQSVGLQDEIYRSVVCELDAIMDEFRKAGIWAH